MAFEKESWSRDVVADKEICLATSGDAAAMQALAPLIDSDTGNFSSSSSSQVLDSSDKQGSETRRANSQKEAEAKSKKEKQEQEKEKLRNDPTTQAGKWATGLQRDIGGSFAWVDVVNQSNVPNDSKVMFTGLFEEKREELKTLQSKLTGATTGSGDAASLVKDAPVTVESYKQLVRRWRKVAAAY